MNRLSLLGCRSRPLASYLGALAVLRLVSEQKDSDARGWWESGRFTLRTGLSEDELVSFFVDEYEPTPILAPWNGGSGFYPKDKKDGIDPLRAAQATRLQPYREAILRSEEVLAAAASSGKTGSPLKEEQIARLRAIQPDRVVEWLDAVLLMTGDGLEFPALLGTGGNDGRLEFTNNFMQRIVELVDPETGRGREAARPWLRASLFEEPVPGLGGAAIGQYDPLSAGGPNASVGFSGAEATNPWSYVLLMEGAVTFSAAATRRADISSARLSYPFTVRSTGSGGGGLTPADDATSRAEMWMPLWQRPATFREVQRIFGEGRMTVGARQARDGLDVVRALGSLGVDRGISSFERFVFAQRNGLAYLATPQGQIRVTRRPETDLIASLDRGRWLERVRSLARPETAPSSLSREARALEDALFAMSAHGGPSTVQSALGAVGRIHRLVGRSKGLRETLAPIHVLPSQWVDRADDGTAEFRVARALASLGGRSAPLRWNLFAVEPDQRMRQRWSPESPEWIDRLGGLDDLLVEVLHRRALWIRRGELPPRCLHGRVGVGLADWMGFLRGRLHSERIRDLLFGLALARISGPKREAGGVSEPVTPPASVALLKLFFLPGSWLPFRLENAREEADEKEGDEPREERRDPLEASRRIPAILGRLGRRPAPDRWRLALEDARVWIRRAGGIQTPADLTPPGRDAAQRWLAGLSVPLTPLAARRLAEVFAQPEDPEAS